MFVYKKKFGIKLLNKELKKIHSDIEKLQLPSGFLQFIQYTLSELFANISEHSKAENIFVNIYMKNNDCKIEITDDGIGIRQSYINKKIYPKDDFSAIEFALSGLSSKSFNERGFGLYSIRKLTMALQGKMKIYSDKAKAIIQKGNIKFHYGVKCNKGVSVIIETKIRNIDFYRFIE